jgi:predicted RNase H-like HicB family nuclease
MNLTIELDREADGRWIAEVPELNILLYGTSREDAIRQAEDAARQIIADRIQRGTLPKNADMKLSALNLYTTHLFSRQPASRQALSQQEDRAAPKSGCRLKPAPHLADSDSGTKRNGTIIHFSFKKTGLKTSDL